MPGSNCTILPPRQHIIYVNQLFFAIVDDFDGTFFFLLVQNLKLLFLCQSFIDPTLTMIKIATRIVTPSTQSTRGSPAGWVALKSWKRLRASNTAAQIDNKTCGRQQSGLRVRMNMISI